MPQNSGGHASNEPDNQPATSSQDRAADEQRGAERRHRSERWFANAAVRTGLTLIGVVLLLFALGQAVGLPLLDLFADAISSETGRWLVVAFFALLLIGAAQRGLPTG